MIINPLRTPQRERRWALVTPGWRTLLVEMADGYLEPHGEREVETVLARMRRSTLYVRGRLAALRDAMPLEQWQGMTWRGRLVRMVHRPTGAKFVTLRDALDTSIDPVDDLARFLAHLRTRGVMPAGFAGMAFALWRSTLDRPVKLYSDPDIGRAALYGSRQAAPDPRRYKHQRAVDIRRAYPHAMGAAPYATRLREVDPSSALDGQGIAEAVVYVDGDAPHPPLPVRVGDAAIQFQRGVIRGRWPWCELQATEALGFAVRVERSWAATATADLFGETWQSEMTTLADLPGAASRLGKSTMNTTWGVFGMHGADRGEVTWLDRDAALHVALAPQALPHRHAAHVAAETAARLRARVLTEALYGDIAPVIHVDTDGVILRRSSPLPSPSGEGAGEWREKGTYNVVDVKAPQVWRGQCDSCGISHPAWHYCVAGVGPDQAESVFRRMPAGVRCGIRGLDTVLPAGHAQDPGALVIEADRAKLARLALYGPALDGAYD